MSAIASRQTESLSRNLGDVSYTAEHPVGVLAGRMIILSGFLATEESYSRTSHAITQRYPLEVVTITHGRGMHSLLAPMKTRAINCQGVFDDVTSGDELPTFGLAHSLGAVDGVRITGLKGLSLETPVGRGPIPGASDILNYIQEEIMPLPRSEKTDIILNTFMRIMLNPWLAVSESKHAMLSNISADVVRLGPLILSENYNANDKLVRPPRGFPTRSDTSLGHLAVCRVPEIGYEHAVRFMNQIEGPKLAPAV